MDEWSEGVGVNGTIGQVERIDRVWEFGIGVDTVEDIVDLGSGSFETVFGDGFFGSAIAFAGHVQGR